MDATTAALVSDNHTLKIKGAGHAAMGECSCGVWVSWGGYTTGSRRVAIKADHGKHLHATERVRIHEALNAREISVDQWRERMAALEEAA